jgi:tRNA(Ile)-lysidine synthase
VNAVCVAPDLTARFTAEMDRLGPYELQPRLAVAVSGGADSMALALLANAWVLPKRGHVLALIVDHGLRAQSSAEADLTAGTLTALGIRSRKLGVPDLRHGPALAERAREARYCLLLQRCVAEGISHLLLGHHRGDQAETVMMRALSGSGSRGLAGMPALVETRYVRMLRPLLDIAPGRLREYLRVRSVAWIEDPSNRDPVALRSRLRAARADPAGTGDATLAIAHAARIAGSRRAASDLAVAAVLAERATIRPEGYVLLTPGPIDADSLAMLLRTVAGARHAPPIDRVAALARSLRPATLGGVMIVPAGRLGPGWLLVREPRAMQRPVPARRGSVWDGRFRVVREPPHRAGPWRLYTSPSPRDRG